jgi:hypothetical protein
MPEVYMKRPGKKPESASPAFSTFSQAKSFAEGLIPTLKSEVKVFIRSYKTPTPKQERKRTRMEYRDMTDNRRDYRR